MSRLIYSIIIFIGVFVLFSCKKNEHPVTNQITPPIDLPGLMDTSFVAIDPSEAQIVTFENGVKLEVPENAFVDANGNVIKGEIELSLLNFNDAASLFSSGIPMRYEGDSSGSIFESAGMVDIQGYANGKPVFIGENKALNLRMPASVEGDFDFYYFEEDAPTKVAMASMDKEKVNNTTARSGKWKKLSDSNKKMGNQDDETESMDTEVLVDLKLDTVKNAGLKELSKLKWPISRKYTDMSEDQTQKILQEEWDELAITKPDFGFGAKIWKKELKAGANLHSFYMSKVLFFAGEKRIITKNGLEIYLYDETGKELKKWKVENDYDEINVIDDTHLEIKTFDNSQLFDKNGKRVGIYPNVMNTQYNLDNNRVGMEKNYRGRGDNQRVFVYAKLNGDVIKTWTLADRDRKNQVYPRLLLLKNGNVVLKNYDSVEVYDVNGKKVAQRKGKFESVVAKGNDLLLFELGSDELVKWNYKTNASIASGKGKMDLTAVKSTKYYTSYPHFAPVSGHELISINRESGYEENKSVLWDYKNNKVIKPGFYVPVLESDFLSYFNNLENTDWIYGYRLKDTTTHLLNLKTGKHLQEKGISLVGEVYVSGANINARNDQMLIQTNLVNKLVDTDGNVVFNFLAYDSSIVYTGFSENAIFSISENGAIRVWDEDLNPKKVIEPEFQEFVKEIGYFNNEKSELVYYDRTSEMTIFLDKTTFQKIRIAYLYSTHFGEYVYLNQRTSNSRKFEIRSMQRLPENVYQLLLKSNKREKYGYAYIHLTRELRDAYERYIASKNSKVKNEYTLMRSFQIRKFGIYNWDRIQKDAERIFVEADFNFGQGISPDNVNVYLVTDLDGISVVKFYPSSWIKFSIDPKVPNKLIAVLPNNEVAVLNNEQIAAMDWETIRNKKTFTFDMSSSHIKIESKADVKALVSFELKE